MPEPSAVVFDQKYPFRVAAYRGAIDLKITAQHVNGPGMPARLELWAVVDFITKLSWHFPISEATTQMLPLGAGFTLVLDLANWAQSEHQLSFDFVVKVQTPIPLVPAIQVYRGGVHMALPSQQETIALATAQGPGSLDQLGQLIATMKSASPNGIVTPTPA